MQITLARLSRKDQVRVGLCTWSAVATCVYAFWLAPARASLGVQKQSLAAVSADLARTVVTDRPAPDVQQRRGALETRLAALQAVIGEGADAPRILRHVQEMAAESELWITGYKPVPAANREFLTEWSVALEFEGSFPALLHFLQATGEYPRLVAVTGLRLRSHPQATGGATLTGTCRLSAFVRRDSPTPAGVPVIAPAARVAAAATPAGDGSAQ